MAELREPLEEPLAGRGGVAVVGAPRAVRFVELPGEAAVGGAGGGSGFEVVLDEPTDGVVVPRPCVHRGVARGQGGVVARGEEATATFSRPRGDGGQLGEQLVREVRVRGGALEGVVVREDELPPPEAAGRVAHGGQAVGGDDPRGDRTAGEGRRADLAGDDLVASDDGLECGGVHELLLGQLAHDVDAQAQQHGAVVFGGVAAAGELMRRDGADGGGGEETTRYLEQHGLSVGTRLTQLQQGALVAGRDAEERGAEELLEDGDALGNVGLPRVDLVQELQEASGWRRREGCGGVEVRGGERVALQHVVAREVRAMGPVRQEQAVLEGDAFGSGQGVGGDGLDGGLDHGRHARLVLAVDGQGVRLGLHHHAACEGGDARLEGVPGQGMPQPVTARGDGGVGVEAVGVHDRTGAGGFRAEVVDEREAELGVVPADERTGTRLRGVGHDDGGGDGCGGRCSFLVGLGPLCTQAAPGVFVLRGLEAVVDGSDALLGGVGTLLGELGAHAQHDRRADGAARFTERAGLARLRARAREGAQVQAGRRSDALVGHRSAGLLELLLGLVVVVPRVRG